LIVGGQTVNPLLGISAADAFFDDTVLQDVRIDLSSADWLALKANFRDDTYYAADFRGAIRSCAASASGRAVSAHAARPNRR
jgi:hypothetical protein